MVVRAGQCRGVRPDRYYGGLEPLAPHLDEMAGGAVAVSWIRIEVLAMVPLVGHTAQVSGSNAGMRV
jgi:hypothetical protein